MDAFWQRISERINNLSHPVGTIHSCVDFTGHVKGRGEGYGVMKIKWPGAEKYKFEKAHRMVYMLHNRITAADIPRVANNGKILECSHICHRNTCINIDHIILETHESNLGRITYQIDRMCHCGNHNPP